MLASGFYNNMIFVHIRCCYSTNTANLTCNYIIRTKNTLCKKYKIDKRSQKHFYSIKTLCTNITDQVNQLTRFHLLY